MKDRPLTPDMVPVIKLARRLKINYSIIGSVDARPARDRSHNLGPLAWRGIG